MELTREEVKAVAAFNFKDTCEKCRSGKEMLATALLAEMDKPKVWDGAPEWVNAARVRLFVNDRNDGHSEVFSETYTRELPKSRERQIAEELSGDTETSHPIINGIYAVDVIEKAILKYKAELEAGR